MKNKAEFDCKQIFNFASRGYKLKIDGKSVFTTFNVPLFLNCWGMAPQDYAMATIAQK